MKQSSVKMLLTYTRALTLIMIICYLIAFASDGCRKSIVKISLARIIHWRKKWHFQGRRDSRQFWACGSDKKMKNSYSLSDFFLSCRKLTLKIIVYFETCPIGWTDGSGLQHFLNSFPAHKNFYAPEIKCCSLQRLSWCHNLMIREGYPQIWCHENIPLWLEGFKMSPTSWDWRGAMD